MVTFKPCEKVSSCYRVVTKATNDNFVKREGTQKTQWHLLIALSIYKQTFRRGSRRAFRDSQVPRSDVPQASTPSKSRCCSNRSCRRFSSSRLAIKDSEASRDTTRRCLSKAEAVSPVSLNLNFPGKTPSSFTRARARRISVVAASPASRVPTPVPVSPSPDTRLNPGSRPSLVVPALPAIRFQPAPA